MNQSTGATSRAKESLRVGTYQFGNWQIETLTDREPGAEVGLVKQVHGGNVVPVGGDSIEADGILLMADERVKAGVYTADCVPLVIMSDEKAAVLHVSRKSIVRGLLENVLTHISVSDINKIYLGPHICEYHFKFEEERELLKQFRYKYPKAVHFHKGFIYLSLRKALLHHFNQLDVHKDKIVEDGRCTYEQIDLPSYRRNLDEDKQDTLRQIFTVVGQ